MGTTDTQIQPVQESPSPIRFKPGDPVLAPTIQDILSADPDQFVAKYTDIAAVNLACAEGLMSSQPIDIPKYLAVLDAMAAATLARVEKTRRLFKLKPAEFKDSEAVFRVMTMEHVARVGYGVQYDDLVAECTKTGKRRDLDSSEIFIHGILSEKRTGTCSSLPVFAVAIGRRCGYPLYFMRVPNHGLYRWHDEHEKFNYQHTDTGGDIFPDEHFLTWPRKWDAVDYELNARTKVWLHSLTARQEVSKFLCNRALCLRDEKRYQEALNALDVAERFDPINPACDDIGYDTSVKMGMGGRRLDPGFNCPPISTVSAPSKAAPTPTEIHQVAKLLSQLMALPPSPHGPTPNSPLPRPLPPHRIGPPLPHVHQPRPPEPPTPFSHLRHRPQPAFETPVPPQPSVAPNAHLLPKIAPARMTPRIIRVTPQLPGTILQPSPQNKEHPK